MPPTLLLARGCGSAGIILAFIVISIIVRIFIRQHRKQQERQAWQDYDLGENDRRLRSSNPVVQTLEPKPQAVKRLNPHSLLAGMRVLVADDSKTIRKALTSLLEPEGITVRRTGSGEGAWQSLRHERLDLLLIEERLPDMSAYEVLQRMRQDKGVPNLPAILLHSQDMLEDPLQADEYATAVLRKPFSSQELLTAVHEAREAGQSLREQEPSEQGRDEILLAAVDSPSCPVCEHPVEDQLKRCSRCGASHHPECWILNDGCGNCDEEA